MFYLGKEVVKLSYEGYESMAVKEMKKIVEFMRSKWCLLKIVIVHRLG